MKELLALLMTSLISAIIFGGSITIKNDRPIQDQFAKTKNVYVINSNIDLNGSTLNVPEGSTLRFKSNGSICNGVVNLNKTLLKGNICLDCSVTGSIINDEIPISCIDDGDSQRLEKRIESILNLDNSCAIILDKDVILSGGNLTVKRLLISGDHRISNSPSFKVTGDIILNMVSFIDFRKKREFFIDLSNQLENSQISLQSVLFDCGYSIDRLIYKPNTHTPSCSFFVDNCIFQNINKYVVQFQSSCTGQISNCIISNHGTNSWGHVICFLLGNNDDYNATNFTISNNSFSEIRAPYSKTAESREAHAILIYGHNNTISNNVVNRIYSTEQQDGDPGKDSEGIYLKGGNNVICNNELIDCVGSGPDGAITIKSNFKGNQIIGNRVKHRFGIGIQCYTPFSKIEKNQIESSYKAEAAIALCKNKSSQVENNQLMQVDEHKKSHKAAIELLSCSNIAIKNNTSDCSSFVTAYRNIGNMVFENNHLTVYNKAFGADTYYSSPIELHSGEAKYIFVGNIFDLKNVKTSQLIEADPKFEGSVQFDDNTIKVSDAETEETAIHFLVRNVKRITKKGNQISHQKTNSDSKLNHLLQ